MAEHTFHRETEFRREKGRTEWFDTRDYIYDDSSGEVLVDSYEEMETLPYEGELQITRTKGQKEAVSISGLSEELARKLADLLEALGTQA